MYVNTPSGRRTKSSAPNLPRALTHSRVAQVLTTCAITALYFGSMAIVGEWYYFSGGDYYGLGTGDALFSLVVCFAMIGLAYYLDKWCGSIARWLGSMGNRVTSIYCIHYTLYAFLYLLLLFFLEDYIPQWWIVPVSILMVAASDLLSRFYKKIKTRKQ